MDQGTGDEHVSGFTDSAARHFVVIKAARQIKNEIEKVGLDNLTILADAGRSIVDTYLDGSSPSEKAQIRRDLSAALQMGITPDMVFSELTGQMPQLASIIESREDYKQSELQKLESFLREGQEAKK